MLYDYLAAEDPQIADAIGQELSRQRSTIELIASENIAFTCRNVGNGHCAKQQVC